MSTTKVVVSLHKDEMSKYTMFRNLSFKDCRDLQSQRKIHAYIRGAVLRLSVYQCCTHRSLQIQEPGRRKADTTGRGGGAICAVLSLEATVNTGDWELTASNWVGPVVSLVLPNG